MKIVFSFIAVLFLYSNSVSASEPSFQCEIFSGNLGGDVRGTLTIFSETENALRYELSVGESKSDMREFSGPAFVAGVTNFTSLRMDVQNAMTSAMGHSRRPGLSTGDLVVFTNTEDPNESTLNINFMPSGQIVYLQIGFLEAFCM